MHLLRLRRRIAFILLGLAPILPLGAAQLGLPEAPAASLGFSPERLDRVRALFSSEIAAQRYAGATWVVVRDGKIVSHGASGWNDVTHHTPMTEDSQVHIFSMSKLITTVTLLTLLEEQKLSLGDPIEKYLPALAKRQVLVGGTKEQPLLEPASRPLTIRDLLTQTSGYSYDWAAQGTLGRYYAEADLEASADLTEFVQRAAALPLAHQPGTHWTYGVNVDLLGAIIERVTGQSLETAMRERVLQPLRMSDTTFHPDAAETARLAIIYRRAAGGGLEPDPEYTIRAGRHYESGGGGLTSNLHDYARFAQMLLNGGTLDGVRILGRKTVEMMTSDQIGDLTPLPGGFGPKAFGFGVRVRLPNDRAEMALGSVGQFGWDGACTTFVTIDPREHLVAIALLQHRPWNEGGIFEKFQTAVYQALVDSPASP